MTSTFPPIPRFVFTVFEPLSLLAGWVSPTLSTEYFVKSQIPSIDTTSATITWPATRILALQLGNVYGLLAMIGIGILYQTREPNVVRNFLIACAIADVGHLYVTYVVMGQDFWDVMHWNELAWGNIGATGFLFIMRCLYFLGAFGEDKVPKDTKQGTKKSI